MYFGNKTKWRYRQHFRVRVHFTSSVTVIVAWNEMSHILRQINQYWGKQYCFIVYKLQRAGLNVFMMVSCCFHSVCNVSSTWQRWKSLNARCFLLILLRESVTILYLFVWSGRGLAISVILLFCGRRDDKTDVSFFLKFTLNVNCITETVLFEKSGLVLICDVRSFDVVQSFDISKLLLTIYSVF